MIGAVEKKGWQDWQQAALQIWAERMGCTATAHALSCVVMSFDGHGTDCAGVRWALDEIGAEWKVVQ